jgi:hypothetical protein
MLSRRVARRRPVLTQHTIVRPTDLSFAAVGGGQRRVRIDFRMVSHVPQEYSAPLYVSAGHPSAFVSCCDVVLNQAEFVVTEPEGTLLEGGPRRCGCYGDDGETKGESLSRRWTITGVVAEIAFYQQRRQLQLTLRVAAAL